MVQLNEWDSFYVIVGSAAGALIGLQFVVMTLLAERPPRDAEAGGAAFATPTIVHFSAVLYLSAILRAPWHTILPVAVLWGTMAGVGLVYAALVIRRMRRQVSYKPGFEDWWFHAAMPLAGYATLALSALAAPLHPEGALFGVGGAALLLLFIGIHNAWDAVVYYVLVKGRTAKDETR